MSFCTVSDVRAVIHSYTLSDADIENLIESATSDVLGKAGTTDETNPYLILAGKFTAYAYTLRKMKTTGELANVSKIGNDTRHNSPDKDIQGFEDQASYYLRKYLNAAQYNDFEGIFGRTGYGTIDNQL